MHFKRNDNNEEQVRHSEQDWIGVEPFFGLQSIDGGIPTESIRFSARRILKGNFPYVIFTADEAKFSVLEKHLDGFAPIAHRTS